MGIESVNNPVASQTVSEIAPAEEGLSVAALETPLEMAPEFETMGFQSFGSFGLQAAAFSAPTTYTIDGLGADLITFSKLSEAKKWAGDDAETVYFRKVVDNGVTYLEPLKAVRSNKVSLSNLDSNELTFVSAGDRIPYSASLPTASNFLKLHSAEQKALVALHGTPKTVAYTAPKTGNMSYVELAFAASGSEPATTAILSQDAKKVHIVEKLQTRDFSFMPYDDQYAISKTAAFGIIKTGLGLTGTTASALAAVQAAIDKIKVEFPDTITSSSPDSAKSTVYHPVTATVNDWANSNITFSGGTQLEAIDGKIGFFTKDQRDLFIKQLEIIKDEISNDMAVFNMTTITDKIGAIGERFKRALAFGNLPVNLSSPDDPSAAVQWSAVPSGFHGQSPTFYTRVRGFPNLISSDDNKTVKEGFDRFIAQEKIYYENAKSRRELIKNIKDNNMTLDAPTLLYRLQIHYNIASEADIVCASEELRQQNDLLNSYSKAQKLLSDTVAINKDTNFLGAGGWDNPEDHKWKPGSDVWGLGGSALHEKSYINYDQIKDISMFQTNNGAPYALAPLHPIEKLRSIDRPRIDITGGDGNGRHGSGYFLKKSVAAWQQIAGQFSEKVNQIGQETQNSLNKISGFEKDKGRYTDMASNTLSKLNEAIMAIGRSL